MIFVATSKARTTNFFPLLICCCCLIWDPGYIKSGSGMNITDPQHCIEEACSPQERTSSSRKNTILHLFFFCGTLLPNWIRIRIQTTKNNADPDLRVAITFRKLSCYRNYLSGLEDVHEFLLSLWVVHLGGILLQKTQEHIIGNLPNYQFTYTEKQACNWK